MRKHSLSYGAPEKQDEARLNATEAGLVPMQLCTCHMVGERI